MSLIRFERFLSDDPGFRRSPACFADTPRSIRLRPINVIDREADRWLVALEHT